MRSQYNQSYNFLLSYNCTSFSFSSTSLSQLKLNGFPPPEYCSLSSNSISAKFFFRPHTPESPNCVGCRSKGQWRTRSCTGSRVRHWWQTVWPQNKRRGTRSPCRVNTSLQTRHSTCEKIREHFLLLFLYVKYILNI